VLGSENLSDMPAILFCRFRLDGIERSQDVQETEGVIPYAVKGNQFYKHRLVLRYLVPANDYQFPNMSLTQVEMVSTKELILVMVFIYSHKIINFKLTACYLHIFKRLYTNWASF
jgi:hypothetical protein